MSKIKNSLIAFASLIAIFGITGIIQAAPAGTARSVASHSAPEPTPVTITATFDFSTFPDVTGTFTTSGALEISGVATMHVGLNANGTRAHCVVTLITSDGTIVIHQECQFATDPSKGRWEIVSGTGAYANLKGNGSLLMPDDEEAMTGVIY
jgi:hypothetical protein